MGLSVTLRKLLGSRYDDPIEPSADGVGPHNAYEGVDQANEEVVPKGHVVAEQGEDQEVGCEVDPVANEHIDDGLNE